MHLAPSLCSALPVRRRRILGLCLGGKQGENHIEENTGMGFNGEEGKGRKNTTANSPLVCQGGRKNKGKGVRRRFVEVVEGGEGVEIRLNRSSLTNITNSWGRVGGWGLVNRKMGGRVGVRRGIKDVMGERGKGEAYRKNFRRAPPLGNRSTRKKKLYG